MPRITLLALAALFLPAAAAAIDVASRVDQVTVYPRGATVTRVAAIELPAGATTITLAGLPDNLDPSLLRAAVDADGVALGALRYGREQRREAQNADIERLNAAIREVESRIAAIDDRIRSEELKLKFLDSLAQGYAKEVWADGARGSADVATWREALGLLESGSSEAYAAIREQRGRRAEAERDLSVLQRELADLRGGALASSFVEVAVSAARAADTSLRLTYFQPSATWRPVYEARLDSEAAGLLLIQQAEVLQQSPEAWTDVALSLSTSDPGGALAPGEIESEFLDLADPAAASSPARKIRSSEAAALAPAAGDLEEVVVTGAPAPRIGNFAVTFDVPGRVTVSNEADEARSYDIGTLRSAVELVTRVRPRESRSAFLAARLDYDGDLPLYESPMRVYVDGAYAGRTSMPAIQPGATVTLPMGDDRRVEVRVTDRGRDRGEEGFVSRRRTETFSYLFEITNRRPAPSLVEIVDRWPVARNEDIEVEVGRGATAPDATGVDEKPGVVLWRRAVEPGETWAIEHSYTISYPADRVLTRR